MSKIAIHLDHPLIDGEQITFRSPCASADATGLKIYTPTSYEDATEVSAVYTLKDAGGATVHSKSGLFATGAYVTVVLDTTNAIAYVHNAKPIYAADLQNNATTTAAGYAMDARMGKTLQDQITSLNDSLPFKIKTYEYNYTLAAGTGKTITGNDFGVSTPAGYQALTLARASTGLPQVQMSAILPRSTGNTTMMTIFNISTVSLSSTAKIEILYTKIGIT